MRQVFPFQATVAVMMIEDSPRRFPDLIPWLLVLPYVSGDETLPRRRSQRERRQKARRTDKTNGRKR